MKSAPTSTTEEKPEEKPKSAQSLKDLCKAIGAKLADGERIYQVEGIGGEVRYVATNSPGNAALTVVAVERVKDKELVSAMFEALNESAKEGGKEK